MDPDPLANRRLASGAPAADPLPQYRGAASQHPRHRARPPAYLPRIRRPRGMAGPGSPGLRRTLPWVLPPRFGFCSSPAAHGLESTRCAGICFNRWATPASYFFYVITGLHAAHLALGVLALFFCLCALARLKRIESARLPSTTAWFWHAMGLAWLILLAFWCSGSERHFSVLSSEISLRRAFQRVAGERWTSTRWQALGGQRTARTARTAYCITYKSVVTIGAFIDRNLKLPGPP